MTNIEMHNLPIIIRLKEWPMLLNNRQPTEHSNCFSTECLPNVKFKLIVQVTDSYKFSVVLAKTPHEAAHVSVKIDIDGCQIRKMTIEDWTDCYTLHGIPFNPVCGMASILFKCELTWYGFVNKLETWTPANLYHKITKFFNDNDFTDVVININGEKISAHKFILAAHSSVFLTMFKKNSRVVAKCRIDVNDVDANIMRKVIEFLYKGEIDKELEIQDLFSILSVAIKFEIIDLQKMCIRVICKKRTVNNSLQILENADLYALPELIENTISFMLKNKQEIVLLDEFKDLHNRKPDIFLDFIVRMSQA